MGARVAGYADELTLFEREAGGEGVVLQEDAAVDEVGAWRKADGFFHGGVEFFEAVVGVDGPIAVAVVGDFWALGEDFGTDFGEKLGVGDEVGDDADDEGGGAVGGTCGSGADDSFDEGGGRVLCVFGFADHAGD